MQGERTALVTTAIVYLILGAALLLAVALPRLLHRQAVSAPLVLVAVGAAIGLLPLPGDFSPSPVENRVFVEHLTEFTVLVALMGVGLAIDRPLVPRRWSTWRQWGVTWRLLGIVMPLSILGVAVLGWWVMGLAPAAALLLGAALSPTDPVLASDVQVGGPTPLETDDEEHDDVDEDDEVRFALTSEAGLNDGLAFPFVYAAVFLASLGGVSEWGLRWLAWELVGKVALGVLVGALLGWGLGKVAFRAPAPSLRLAETGEPLLALAAVLATYGAAEIVGGYGFLAVFACALALRSAERGHDYHVHMHQVIERLERLFTLIVLLLLGVSLTNGLLEHLSWRGVLLGVVLVLLLRPLAGLVALGGAPVDRRERLAIAFFGVRGVGSLYYLAYATGSAEFARVDELWATVGFTVVLSVVVHGIAATPVMRRLDRVRDVRPEAASTA